MCMLSTTESNYVCQFVRGGTMLDLFLFEFLGLLFREREMGEMRLGKNQVMIPLQK